MGYYTLFSLLVGKVGVSIETKNIYGYTPLHISPKEGNIKALPFLAENINVRTAGGDTALHIAAKKGYCNAMYFIKEYLWNYSITISFFFAAIVRYLVEKCIASIRTTDKDRDTLLQCTYMCQCIKKYLQKKQRFKNSLILIKKSLLS